jgi:hypothetical protein
MNAPAVRDLANNLTFGKKWKITIAEIGKEDDAEPGKPVFMSGEQDKPKTPREHYIKACQMLLTFLVFGHHDNPVSPPPTPGF